MCVAVVLKGEAPTEAQLTAMDRTNPHGAGIGWWSRGTLHYVRDLTVAQLCEYLPKLPRPALLHFRWATHGGIWPDLIHPFPVGPAAIYNRVTYGTADRLLIHNGVWSDYRKHLPPGVDDKDVSDTAVAAFRARYDESVLDDVMWSNALGVAGKRGMRVVLRGNWEEFEGNWYSNLDWRKERPRYSMYGFTDTADWEQVWSPTTSPALQTARQTRPDPVHEYRRERGRKSRSERRADRETARADLRTEQAREDYIRFWDRVAGDE